MSADDCPCIDCGIATLPTFPNAAPGHWYMVRDEVWAEAAMSDGYLCLRCLTQRLGRDVQPNDLDDLPINMPGLFRDSLRLHVLKFHAHNRGIVKDWFAGLGAVG